MSIRLKLLSGFGLLIALCIGLAMFAVRKSTELGHMVVAVYDQPLMSINHARAAQAGFQRTLAAAAQGASQSEASGKAATEGLSADLEEIGANLAVVAERVTSPEATKALEVVEARLQEWRGIALPDLAPGHPLAEIPAPWVAP